MLYQDAAGVFRSSLLDELPWLIHGFGTRHVHPHPSPVTLKQTHSDRVLKAASAQGCEGDALLAAAPGEVVAVKTADCVPILLADPRRRVAAAVHSGWRGTARRIVIRTVETMAAEYGSSPSDLVAAIGPAIGPCCYEIGPEVVAELAPLGSFCQKRSDSEGRVRFDLWEANRRLLAASGVSTERTEVAGVCTFCDSELFHSYRRDREAAGRMYSVIGIRDGR